MKRYSIGLDIGTSSVGWAVVDENNHLIRYKKKNMWGARLFDEADKAEGRRKNRTARRRLKRRAQRVNFLQQIFAPIVLPVDDGFFIKLNESVLWEDDKTRSPLKLSLQDAGYYAKNSDGKLIYPTIYHLRHDLATSTEQKDPRLVYLAIHHIIKYRGNFLYQKDFSVEDSSDISEKLTQLAEYLEENFGFDSAVLDSRQQEIIAIIKQTDKSRSARRSEIEALLRFDKTNKAIFSEVVKMILGLKADGKKIFADLEDELKIEFSGKYEDRRDEIAVALGDERMEFIDLLEAIYNWGVLQSVLKGEHSISQAMINKYNSYAADLKFIKQLFRENLPHADYKVFFKSKNDAKGESSHYTKYTTSGYNYAEFIKDFEIYFTQATDDFAYSYADFKKDAGSNKPPEKVAEAIDRFASQFSLEYAHEFIERLNNGEAFSKQRMSDNGAIPYQLHKNELIKIIENQGRHYPELLETVDNGDGKQRYKLIRLLEHRIPYYVGPLQTKNQNNSDFAWMKPCEKDSITPFNFYQKVDKIASAEAFINNLTNNCMYLPDKPVLPRHSLLFSEFVVRNELKNLKIDGEKISIEVENKIFTELFLQHKKVTRAMLVDLLKRENFVTLINNSSQKIEGMAQASSFTAAMQSYVDLTQKIRQPIELEINSQNYLMAENLIKWVTVFEDKEILREKIEKEYGTQLTPEQITAICKLNYSGWASLSCELLTTIKNTAGDSIIDLMRDSRSLDCRNQNCNFIQIISTEEIKNKLKEALEKYNEKHNEADVIDSIPASPALKRGIRQARKLVDEIIELNDGQKPAKIYIEMARGGEKGGRKGTRKAQLKKLHNSIEIDSRYCSADELKRVKEDLENWESIDKEKRYLYFLQLGKCAYSGQGINLNAISQECEVEHILPQSMVKDDSLDNKVLVYKKFNQDKGGCYPLNPEIVRSQRGLWEYWNKNKLITDTKLVRLTKSKEKFEAEKSSGGFIKRQLVETRQISKHIAALFNKLYRTENEVDVVEPVKARIVSEFRDKFDLPKSRTINDFHHAKDAYLNAVLGQYLRSKFPDRSRQSLYNRYMSFKKDETKEGSANKQRDDRELSFVLAGIGRKEDLNRQTGEIVDGEVRIDTIRRTMAYNDCLVTRMLVRNSGKFYNINLQKKEVGAINKKDNKKVNLIDKRKGLPSDRYGGYSDIQKAYNVAAQYYDVKGKRKSELIGIPIDIANKVDSKQLKTIDFIRSVVPEDASDVKILRDKILKYQVIKRDGSMQMLVSDREVCNARQLFFDFKTEQLFATLDKKDKNNKEMININRLYRLESYDYLRKKLCRILDVGLDTDVDTIRAMVDKKLDEMFEIFIDKLKNNYRLFSSLASKIEAEKPTFYRYSTRRKMEVLDELLTITQANSQNANFKTNSFGGLAADRMGRVAGQNIKPDDIEFYDYSITGLKVKKEKL